MPESHSPPAARLVPFAVLALAGAAVLAAPLFSESGPRPADFLQVWSAGRLALAGENPYDGASMFDLQMANRAPQNYAAMMWVPPWGLVLAVPMGALPIGAAQLLWTLGQFALAVAAVVWLWRQYGGARSRAWVPAALALGFGPLWWQTLVGQYAGLLLLALAGFVAAHRANRPVLAGACLFLVALKPHLFAPLAVGLLLDAVRTGFARRVVLGGALALGAAALAVTALNPALWEWYAASATGSSPYYPALRDWFNPTPQAWVRAAVPGRPFWVQFVPLAVAVPAFALFWWRRGGADRWPGALPWVVPAGLLVAPYGSWPSDFTLFLLPLVWVAVRLDATGWAVRSRGALLAAYAVANVAVLASLHAGTEPRFYVWMWPAFAGCLCWALLPATEPARARAVPA